MTSHEILVDPDAPPQGAVTAEQLVPHRVADDAGGAPAAHFPLQEAPAGCQLPVLRDEVAVVGADHRRAAAFRPVDHRRHFLARGCHCAHTAKLRLQRFDVAEIERLGVGAGAAGPELSRAYEQQVAAELGQLRRDLGRRAVADRHHGDHRTHADDDAERGEERSHRVAPDGACRASLNVSSTITRPPCSRRRRRCARR